MSKYLNKPIQTKELPKGVPYIISNEAAERFSFYGMKSILVIYMTQYLFQQGENNVTEENAKIAFAHGYKKFPTGPKAPDILLKLGMSFRGAMDDANACVIFKELNDDHPNAPAVIITRLEQERAKAGCQ